MESPFSNVKIFSPRPSGVVVGLFLVTCLGLIWLCLGDHPLHGRSEGRYAVIAQNMAEGTGWSVPMYFQEVHLEKPPLTAWCEALCIRAFGSTELAVRIPSALAGSLVVVTLLAFAWRVVGWRAAMLATGVMAVMPLHLAITRLTLTDGPLALYWWGALAAGYLCVAEPERHRWRVLLWVSVALGLLTKGPVALAPVGVLLAWLALGRRWNEVKSFSLVPGFLLSLIPLIGWVVVVAISHPEAIYLWYHETIGRAGEHADHPQPFWYFIPIFLGGMFPASALMTLPGLNYPVREVWPKLRSGGLRTMLALAVLLPFVMFSLIRGKLSTYILPLCPPMALLTGMMLDDWLSGRNDIPEPGANPPEVRYNLLLVSLPLALAATIAIWTPPALVHRCLSAINQHLHHPFTSAEGVLAYLHNNMAWLPLPLLMLASANVWLASVWQRRPMQRLTALTVTWIALVILWLGVWGLENQVMKSTGSPALIAEVKKQTGLQNPRFITMGFQDTNIPFYTHADVPMLDDPTKLENAARSNPSDLILIADPKDWRVLEQNQPEVVRQFEQIMKWPPVDLLRSFWVFRPRPVESSAPATRP